ncbi:hypothetical protein PHYPSEUDO_005620 [Phytophthora pseudosyringae]|uniref:Uncharacterized protein n=1 Tax=Phytophthora pseudosyringae TaxID=221518 RepID=A0A8T1VKP5_9STRA|nr:hypothetical protein PHYPSEUDO_005620 [Phytophthora pseudosyringae]
MESLPTLPLPLLQSILGFAVPGYAEYLPPERRNGVTFVLKDLKLVAKAWAAPMREIVHQYRDSALVLRFKTLSDQELQQTYQKVSERGAQITELCVSTGTIDSWSQYFTMPLKLWEIVKNTEDRVDWPRIFAHLTALKSLNLEANFVNSRHVIGALEAAATHCLKLETLVLPAQRCGGGDEHIQAVLDKLYDAMKRWRVHGNRGGLRHLKVPTRNNSKESFKASKAFFENVMENCPDVEFLDGYNATLSRMDCLTCEDAWFLTLEDWEKLNAICTKLREFDWVVAPFADPFFRAFGEHVKPQLKKLTFGVNMRWNWRWYFHDGSNAAGAPPNEGIDDESYCKRPGYGFFATNPAAALNGCPLLDELVVKLYHAVDRVMYIPPDMGDVYDFPEEEMVDQNIFDDNFCETLASQCPFLTQFVIKEVGEYFNRNDLMPILPFTDRGLMALTQLKFLRSLQLRSINCTGNGILEFLNAQSNKFTGNRTFEITVGGSAEDFRLVFYDVVKELLVQLADTPDFSCTRQKFALRIENWSYNSRYFVDPAWSETYFNELKKLMNRVKDAHPSLRQHVVMMNHSGNSFSRIAEFGLYTEHTEPVVYCSWEDWEQEEENGGITIVDREDLLPDDSRAEDDRSDFSGYGYSDGYLEGDFYDGEEESDIDSEYFEDDSDFEM